MFSRAKLRESGRGWLSSHFQFTAEIAETAEKPEKELPSRRGWTQDRLAADTHGTSTHGTSTHGINWYRFGIERGNGGLKPTLRLVIVGVRYCGLAGYRYNSYDCCQQLCWLHLVILCNDFVFRSYGKAGCLAHFPQVRRYSGMFSSSLRFASSFWNIFSARVLSSMVVLARNSCFVKVPSRLVFIFS